METKCEHKNCEWAYQTIQCKKCGKIFKRNFEYEDIIMSKYRIEKKSKKL